MGAVRIIRGRGFVEQDRDPAQQAVIISESLARRAFPNEQAVGKRIRDLMKRNIRPLLKTIGLGWVDYRVMRRTHSSFDE